MPSNRPSSRAAWGSLSRDAVIDKAVEFVTVGAADELSIRALAAALDVSPMSLYRHVQNKEDLLDEVVSRLLADRWQPTLAERWWRPWIADAADRLRAFLVEQPLALQVYLRRPVVTATALRRMDACLRVLTRGLGDEERARSAYAAIQTYTLGFAALEAGREAAGELADPVVEGPDAGSPDAGTSTLRELAAFASPAQFRVGLDYLLTGISG